MSMSQQQLYFYKPEGLALIKHPSGVTSALLRAAERVLMQRDDNQVASCATDVQGSIMRVVGQGSCSMQYTAYGFDSGKPCASVLRYTGQRKEPVTGHYLLGNGYRAFNPVLMRLNAPDNLSPFGAGGLNCYCYCNGDPVNKIDPSGHSGRLTGGFRVKSVKKTTPATIAPAGKGAPYEATGIDYQSRLKHLGRDTGELVQSALTTNSSSMGHKLAVEGSLVSSVSEYGELLKVELRLDRTAPDFPQVSAAITQMKSELMTVITPLAEKDRQFKTPSESMSSIRGLYSTETG